MTIVAGLVVAGSLGLGGCASSSPGPAVRIAVSAHDAKVFLNDGVSHAVIANIGLEQGDADTVSVIDFASATQANFAHG